MNKLENEFRNFVNAVLGSRSDKQSKDLKIKKKANQLLDEHQYSKDQDKILEIWGQADEAISKNKRHL